MGGSKLLDMDPGETKPQSQTQRAVTLLREMVISNKLLPGSNHLEAELAELLGMSRTPVREAAIILEGQGLVEVRPRRGVRVLPISPKDMEEIYSILTELESLAAHDLAMKGLSDSELAELRHHIEEMEHALEKDDRQLWAQVDDRFHRRLIQLAGNRRLQTIVSTYSDQVHRARLLTLYIRPAPHQSNADHRALVEAIAAGKAEEAREIHRQHRLQAKELMIELITSHGFSAI
ncbi:GntR family transcriptional regulator [Nitratireductor kimnyeongensis]|uniref:GntR family transcriptional regulator n=1 Tax=Nitratireductor kimnyeongensis TaxID=430679 RepID=A0ABW0T964_9HYPH|nr:GntR family transcriptional regulator [Nitratireductor kimnyeongensis]QZZ34041.1 GntR family transcriptional regulator [Nitratireductor kimnyeongensis]